MKWLFRAPLKLFAIILIITCFFQEWRNGYFKKIGLYFKTAGFKLPLQILVTFFGLTLCILPFDPILLQALQSLPRPLFPFLSSAGGFLGRGINPWLILALCYFLPLLVKRRDWTRLAFGGLLASIFTVLLSALLKYIILRARPYGEWGGFSFFNIDGLLHDKRVFQSFPSGDVASVAGAAAFFFYISKNFSRRWFILLLPLATAFSRVYLNKHWPSDTLFSVGLGLFTARFVFDYHRFLNSGNEKGT